MANRFSERERQKAAYNLLKSAGKKVKPNFEDYLTGRGRNRSLINRANKLQNQTDTKTFFNARLKKEITYTRFTERYSEGTEIEQAISDAQKGIILRGSNYEQVQIGMYGTFRTKTDKVITGWITGEMSRYSVAVKSFLQAPVEWIEVRIMQLYFAKNR
jgi:hypothetical protein